MENGWIKLHRKLRDNVFYKNPNALALWLECLLRASHTDRDFYWKRERVKLNSGQFLYGEEELGATFGLSRQTARYWVEQFVIDNMLDIKKTSKGTIGTVINWEVHQSLDSNVDNKKTTKRQQKDTNKNDKKEKNDKNTTNVVEKTSYGRPDINECYTYFEGKLGTQLDGSRQSNRNMCKLLLDKVAKNYPDYDPVVAVKRLIDVALADGWHGARATNFRYLYSHMQKLVLLGTDKQKKTAILDLTQIK